MLLHMYKLVWLFYETAVINFIESMYLLFHEKMQGVQSKTLWLCFYFNGFSELCGLTSEVRRWVQEFRLTFIVRSKSYLIWIEACVTNPTITPFSCYNFYINDYDQTKQAPILFSLSHGGFVGNISHVNI